MLKSLSQNRPYFKNFSIIKPTRCTNFTNLFWHETLHVSDISSVYHQEFIHCTLSNGICHTGLQTAFEQGHPGPGRKLCEISASSWFYYKEICYDARSHITMHGHTNVKYFKNLRFYTWPASWLGGQSSWLLTMRSRIRFSTLPCVFFLERGRSPWWPWSG